MTMPKLERVRDVEDGNEYLYFYCPGCRGMHSFRVKGRHPAWSWNEDMERPTFRPSLLIRRADGQTECHLFVEDGQIRFLNDCGHALAGQTVPLPEMEVQ